VTNAALAGGACDLNETEINEPSSPDQLVKTEESAAPSALSEEADATDLNTAADATDLNTSSHQKSENTLDVQESEKHVSLSADCLHLNQAKSIICH
jgi:hypothetical protein